jgi:Mg-chelatase subunit ChlD
LKRVFLTLALITFAAGAQSARAADPPSSTVRLYGQVNELLSACANAGVTITSTTLPAKVEKVRLGSPAYYGGLQENDVIIKGSLNKNRLQITFKRGAMTYGLDLATEAGSGTPATSLKGSNTDNKFTAQTSNTTLAGAAGQNPLQARLQAGVSKDPAWRKLQKYDIVMLIDQSGSMNDVVTSDGFSKWDWCKNQLTSFASQALENTGRRFTIITFNGEYRLRSNCSAAEVQSTFNTNHPEGATDLATPLDFVLKDYLQHNRINPLLVVVLTDGMPAAPELIEKSIIETTHQMATSEQIKIVFLEIGNDADGRALIRQLDAGLVSGGARYDIVDANTFERLQQVGLKAALYDTFNQNFRTSLRVAPNESLQSELEIVRKQLQAARARAAQNPANR